MPRLALEARWRGASSRNNFPDAEPRKVGCRKECACSVVPSGLVVVTNENPALKRRAILGCPCGTKHRMLGARRERLVDAAFFEGHVFRQAAFDRRFDFPFD